MEAETKQQRQTLSIPTMFRDWYIDYASYVILERAVPHLKDGLKPVQRRILHSMYELDDGRYNKVANVVGNTMKYHPHGDASIGDAMVQLGQKDLLIDCQGNWGNILTGDSAAAPRYIEARLSKFALDVVFNKKTTEWKPSYDGRNDEPVTLPVKFPLLLFQGVEGIAVGLACKILPHNFIELIDASIAILKGEEYTIYPDFATGGLMDASAYQEGTRGGRVRVRAKIEMLDKKTLVIREIPFSTTTDSLIESIVKANEKGKIKVRKVEDNTSETVEIIIHLQPGVSPDTTIDALYAFTDCEVSISPNACVISDSHPQFLNVREILEYSTQSTKDLLEQELKIRLDELQQDWYYTSLEKIFFEERLYRHLEKDVKKWDDLIAAIEKAFVPFHEQLRREVTREDIERLTEKPVRKISKFDVKKADEHIGALEKEMKEVRQNLKNLTDYAVAYFERIKTKYGKGRERKTEIRSFETIEASMVAASNQKLYVNRQEGFVGTALRKDEYIGDCSDIDDIIAFKEDGTFVVTRISDKVFVGKNIIHVAVFKRNDDRTIYNMAYQDGKDGNVFVKRFAVKGITRDKEYNLTRGLSGSKILYFTANPNGEAEVIKVFLKPRPKLKKLNFDYDFKELAVKGRDAMGNILSRNPIKKIVMEGAGVSTLGARKIWYDATVQRLNVDGHGTLLGEFKGNDKILTLMDSGAYRLTNYDLSLHFDNDMFWIGKSYPDRIITAVYKDLKTDIFFIKRFLVESSDKRMSFIEENEATLITATTDFYPLLNVKYAPKGKREAREESLDVSEFIAVKGYKAKGKRISNDVIEAVSWLPPAQPNPDYEFLLSQQLGEEPELDEDGDIDMDFVGGDVNTDTANVTDSSTEKDNPTVNGTGQLELF
ncbi:MAG: DNA gyrase/topoisomerase IV subunit A [Bacteroidales bacterium]|jgi:topoisomerase-4 subunit A|nr:DNA gyrase/topoisomerase IV subunit A [Bacteroidales bacterium]